MILLLKENTSLVVVIIAMPPDFGLNKRFSPSEFMNGLS
jgi:hypothetical protein